MLAAFLEPRIDELAAELTALYRDKIPGYADLPAGEVRAETRGTLEAALGRLRLGEGPGEADAAEIAARARRWAAMDWPLDVIGRSFQIGTRRVVAIAREHAAELGLDPHALFALQDRAWDWATLSASVVGEVQRDAAVSRARRDAARRADFLRDLAAGRLTPERLAEEAALHGLDLGHRYVTVCAAADEAVAPALETKVRESGSTSEHRALQTVVDGRLLAVAPQRPSPVDGATLAIGPPALLRDAHASFAEAEQALGAARAFGISGAVDLDALGPLALVTAAGDVAERLEATRLAALDELGAAGAELEETVRTLLEADQSVEETARRLHLHRNSVRHRVVRFREVTGLDLRRTDDLVLAWWLLRRRQARRRG